MSSVPQNVIKHKVGLLNLAAELGNVSRACKVMGFSRDTFYRYQSAMASGGVDALRCCYPAHRFPIAAIQRKCDSHPLTVIAAKLEPMI
jgi:hypothetical protein